MSGVVLTVKVVPGSSKTALAGTLNGMLKVKVAAPPERGKANEALIDFLAETLGVKRNGVTLVRGHTHSVKQVRISGAMEPDLLRRLSEITGCPDPASGTGRVERG
ncbi:MAG: DUF167 domain-containing protein [Phycisphaerae bacterium]|nr:DUF167 domain-containing protein [Phycisphaerae bacterium]